MSKTLKIVSAIITLIIIISTSFYVYTYFKLKKDKIIPTYTKEKNITIKEDFITKTIENTNESNLEKIFSDASEDAGFHFYYPTFIPDDLIIDKDKIFWTNLEDSTGKIASIDLIKKNNPDSRKISIIISQFYMPNYPQKTINKIISKLENKKEVSINGIIAYSGEYGNSNNIIFSSKDGTDIRIYSSTYNIETLVKIAESLK